MMADVPIADDERPEPMMVFRPNEALARRKCEEDRADRRQMRRMAFWFTVLAGLFGGMCAIAAIMSWWELAYPFCIASVLFVLQSRTTMWGFPGAEGRYHRADAAGCTTRVRQEQAAGDRAYVAKFGPVADAPEAHAEEYSILALQVGQCLRYRRQLEERMAQLRGERPAD